MFNRTTVLVCALVFANPFLFQSRAEAASPICGPVFHPQSPGLQQCVVDVSAAHITADVPDPKQTPLWCWAASLAMIYTEENHPITQEEIVQQNFGDDPPAITGGDMPMFVERLNRSYVDNNGNAFTSSATRILTPADAESALENDHPILYTTTKHATVQLEMRYQQTPGGPMAFKGGMIWDPEPGAGWHSLSVADVTPYRAAWSITTTAIPAAENSSR